MNLDKFWNEPDTPIYECLESVSLRKMRKMYPKCKIHEMVTFAEMDSANYNKGDKIVSYIPEPNESIYKTKTDEV